MAESANSIAAAAASPIKATRASAAENVGVRVAQNAGALFGGRALALVFAAGANAVLARYLGVEKLGEYGAIYAYLALFSWISTLGLAPVMTREAAETPEASGTVIGTGVRISAAAALPTLALTIAFAPVARLGGSILPLVILAGVEILVVPVLMVPGLMYQVNLQQWYPAAYGIARQALWFAAIVVLYFAGAPLIWIIAGRLAAAAIEGALNWKGGTARVRGQWLFDWSRGREMIRHGFPVAIGAFAGWIYLRIDQVMLHWMVSDYALGQYVAAVRISELTETIPAAIVFAIFPVLCAATSDPQKFDRYLKTIFRVTILGAGLLCLAIFATAQLIIALYYGKQFAAAAPLLRLLVWSEIAVFFNAVVTTALLARASERLIVIPTICGAAINVALNLVLIPKWGAYGACWASLVSYGLGSTITLLFIKSGREILIPGWRVLGPAAALCAISLGLAHFVPGSELFRGILAVTAFAILAILLKLVTPDDLTRARDLWTRLRARSAGAAA